MAQTTPEYTDQDFMLDLSQVSNGTRFNALEGMRRKLEDEFINIADAITRYDEGCAKQQMVAWQEAIRELLGQITVMQRKLKLLEQYEKKGE